MFEYVKDAILSIDILGTGAYMTFTALGIGIASEISDGNMQTFMIINIIWQYACAVIIFGMTTQSVAYLVTSILITTILMMPTGIKDIILKKRD